MMFPYLQTAIKNLTKKPLTMQFPCPEDQGAPRYRGRIEFDAESCVDCGMCIKVCGPMAISREEEELNSLKVQRDRLAEDASADRQRMQWKIKVNAAIGMKEGKIKDLEAKKSKVQAEIDKGSEARATITEVAYSGTVFVIDRMVLRIEDDRKTYDKLTIKASADRDSIEVI